MRILFYGLQNSGATLVALFAGQRSRSLVIPDLWTMYRAPYVDSSDDLCVKATVTAAFPLHEHVAAMRPDHVFLVVRRPVDNYASLRSKVFARHDGTPEEKFAIADRHFVESTDFTDVIVFEDFVADPSMLHQRLTRVGWQLPADAADLPRTPLQMEQHIWQSQPELYAVAQWGTGQARPQPLRAITLGHLDDKDAERFCVANSPRLHAYYDDRLQNDDLAAVRGLQRTVQDETSFQGRANFVSNQVALVDSYLREGERSSGLELAVELCTLAPDSSDAWATRARALDACGRSDEAREVLEQALATTVEGSSLQLGLYIALTAQALRNGDLDRCHALATELAQQDPGCTAAHQSLADVALRQNRFEDASKHAEAVLMREPRSVNARRMYAEALYGQGRIDEACDWMRSCLALAPGLRLAQRRLAQFLADRASAP